MRGIDAYTPEALPGVFHAACSSFRRHHRRLPDLFNPPSVADHFFLVKFFHPIPLHPNPADKLEAPAYLPNPLRSEVAVAARPWASPGLYLPPDDIVPEGRYWLKLSTGSGFNIPLHWPPDKRMRARIDRSLAALRQSEPYGVKWGEWWYSRITPHLFLEEDLTERMGGRPEVKVFVRDGRVRAFYCIRHHKASPHEQAWYAPDLTPLRGLNTGYRPLDAPLPARIASILKAAGAIGRPFRVVRVDFIDTDGPPCFGEITLCHLNGNFRIDRPALDARLRRDLFG